MKKVSLADLLKLSVPERIQLAEDLWDSVTEVPESVEVSDAQRKELDRRLEAYHQDPKSGSPWEAVKASLRKTA
jgi:putative addiction module component (TIGR02574 family)